MKPVEHQMNREKAVDASLDASEIIVKMSRLRREISAESTTLVERTRLVFDWKHQVAAHPIVSAVAAAAVGYLLVPKRTSTSLQLPQGIAEALSVNERIEVPTSRKSSLLESVAKVFVSMLARNAASLAMSKVNDLLAGSRSAVDMETTSNGDAFREPLDRRQSENQKRTNR
jgi:hypothetical protein